MQGIEQRCALKLAEVQRYFDETNGGENEYEWLDFEQFAETLKEEEIRVFFGFAAVAPEPWNYLPQRRQVAVENMIGILVSRKPILSLPLVIENLKREPARGITINGIMLISLALDKLRYPVDPKVADVLVDLVNSGTGLTEEELEFIPDCAVGLDPPAGWAFLEALQASAQSGRAGLRRGVESAAYTLRARYPDYRSG